MPEIALAKVNREAPLDVVCTLACGATTGIGAALYIAKVGGPDTVEQIVEMTDGFGADYTSETTGSIAVMRQASSRRAWVGPVHDRRGRARRRCSRSCLGTSSPAGAKRRDRVPELVERYLAGDLDLDSLVTRRVPLDEVDDAFEAMERQQGIRTVITY